MPGPLPLCVWCKKNKVKLLKNETCSRSCASQKRWKEMQESQRIVMFRARERAAKKTQYAIRLQAEFERLCIEFNLIPERDIRKLFIKARNNGYHAGFYTGQQRGRKQNAENS